MNNQPIEKLIKSSGNVLDIHSIFLTIQGEGIFTGHPAVFIRLAGCNLMCPNCDTDYTVGRKMIDTKEIISQVFLIKSGAKLVVVTGGEPFRQNITLLCNELIDKGMAVQVETNGTLPIPPEISPSASIVVSPKTHHVHKSVSERAVCAKYVVSAKSVGYDGLPNKVLGNEIKGIVKRLKIPVYIQPEDSYNKNENKANLQTCIKSSLLNGYILQVQTHKIIGVE